MTSEEISFKNIDDGQLYKIMLHYLILRYSYIQWFISVLKWLTLFVPEWFESAVLMINMGFCSNFLNQNKLKTLMDPRAFGELENIGYCM